MNDERVESLEGGEAQEEGRSWRPSRRPDYTAGSRQIRHQPQILEQASRANFLRATVKQLKKPLVKVSIGLSLFIAGVIIFDATVNQGSWTERKADPRPTRHKNAK